MNLIDLAESGWLPDALIRLGIRQLLNRRLKAAEVVDVAAFADQLRASPLAVQTDAANQQHYEVPADFFQQVLGPSLKYSACLFETPQSSLAAAEYAMLRVTCERAEIADGMRVLELGCGWGSLTLWMAGQYPACQITALSNSNSQRNYIEAQARDRGLRNVTVVTKDIRSFSTTQQFDRVVSVEMFEHTRNYQLLLHRVANWLHPSGKAFVHVFCHRQSPYLFETEGTTNWMGRHFFTGGMMPCEDLFRHFDQDLAVERQWRVNGLHYWRTCEHWLRNLDNHRSSLLERFAQDMPAADARRTLERWRMFFMACAELFRYRGGNEWFVAHYLMQPTVADCDAQPAALHAVTLEG
ncbi:SAM-dependent methyltransferase [Roseimaritima ulvae]|uniref:Cyclopropane-fatty-acyl-phospholipid synthase n=1 Tax=Roseimaritima ulvae TaxID=980254 RepID=A0A5B9QPF7_9BACT|nr:cyclopropane-fatty-acyl-phospholipid synthase family protein [Roseimaritima ulvae]QEG40967.1 Cyclopropane-fatty-acyl-phospholipid synthase [Roseimaritima ulvae]